MFPSLKREIPEFITEYLIFCDCFININKQKTCLVLTKNLKFMEFHRKQLVACIDLNGTCLNKLCHEIENYKGPKGKWYEASSTDGTDTDTMTASSIENAMDISFGKYVFHALNIYKIYIIIQCWDKCIVLKRLCDFKGFEIKAEYEELLDYKITHGLIKYCPVVEFKFKNNEIFKTDFENEFAAKNTESILDNKNCELNPLLERIRSAKTELQLHKSITAHSFRNIQNNLTMGLPFLRSVKLEEKQMLYRCGDIWKRFTPNDDLVIGIPLVNANVSPNLTIIRNLTPLLQPNLLPENSIQLEYRLFQLKLKFDQLDSLEVFLETENEQLQGNIWCSNKDMEILPESFVVLLIKLKISQIISLKQTPLLINYEVVTKLYNTPGNPEEPLTMSLQLFLQILDFHQILYEERSKYELKFQPQTLHQDFLTVAMTSQETNLKITFATYKDLDIFERFLQEKLDFIKPPTAALENCTAANNNVHFMFYNKNPSSLWFGGLILRSKEIPEDDNNQCQTTWTIYCQNLNKTLILIKTLINDLLTLQCNIVSIVDYEKQQRSTKHVADFENALRQELLQLQTILSETKKESFSQKRLQIMDKLFKIQMDCDVIAKDVIKY